MQIEVGIPTKDRYENLALALWSVADQTYQNFKVTIIDDSDDRKDIRSLPYIFPILKRLDSEGHAWRLFYGEKKGPHWSFQKTLDSSRYPYVFMMDDDCIMDVKCLEYLVEAWKAKEPNTRKLNCPECKQSFDLSESIHDRLVIQKEMVVGIECPNCGHKFEPIMYSSNWEVAAVGPIVMIPGANAEFSSMPVGYKWFKRYNGFIDEYGKCYGDHQWRYHPDDELQECDHLQCQLVSLETVRSMGGFDLNYNFTAYRTETDLCYTLFKSGRKLYIQPKALVWHSHDPSGGIRKLNPTKELYDQADEYYHAKFGFKRGKNQDRVIRISGGLGDHLCATPLFRALKKKGKVVVSAIYPFLFVGNPNVDELIFINDEPNYEKVDQRSIYKWAMDNSFSGRLSEAWCRTYGEKYDGDKLDYTIFPAELEWADSAIAEGMKPFIIIAPYASISQIQYADIQKEVPSGKITNIRDWFKDRWEQLVKEIQSLGYHVFQVGGLGEEKIEGCDAYHIGINYRLTIALLQRSAGFIGVDSFLQHAANAIGRRGVVLYGPSDSRIGAHKTNINLKSNLCDKDNICMKQSFPISHWTFKSKDCDSKLCMKSISVEDVLEQVKRLVGALV